LENKKFLLNLKGTLLFGAQKRKRSGKRFGVVFISFRRPPDKKGDFATLYKAMRVKLRRGKMTAPQVPG
jgi:hypothetical protein